MTAGLIARTRRRRCRSVGCRPGHCNCRSPQAARKSPQRGRYPDLSPESYVFISKWTSEHSDDIASYLDWLATFDVQDEIKGEETEGITLATIHASKGLEWPIVIIAGCNEGIIPARPNDLDEIEGERRLFYTAMTRAMDQLILTIRPTESTDAAGRKHTSPESRFIIELQGDKL